MIENTSSRSNPYVGPRAFQTGERLYGRDREVRELLDLLIAERIVLLNSPSGAGKSSLIQAGLVPALETERFRVLPVVRVNLEPPASVRNIDDFNRYVFSVMLSIEESYPAEQQTPIEALASLSLEAYLAQCPREEDSPDSDVLIFDQFEEILTASPTDRQGKMEFFNQLGVALRDCNRWALFSMREDFVAALSPYVRPVPTRFANTFRLDLLGRSSARQAIQQPARQAGVDFTDSTAQKLVDDLRRVLVQQPDGSMEEQLGLYVEPVQLQVVCYRLWSQLPDEATRITEEHLASIGDVDQSLADYYAEKVQAIAGDTMVSERSIREWVDRKLITEGGLRGQVLMGEEKSGGLDNHAIRELENSHLVRGEKRRGATWFELAHDRLITPVQRDNALWSQTHLSILQRQATLWEQQDRSENLYLRDEALLEAEKWATDHPDELSQVDREFLETCLELRAREEAAREAAERERRLKLEAAEQLAEAERRRAEEQAQAASRLRRRAYILGVVLVIAVILAGLAFFSYQVAQQNDRVAQEQRSVAQEQRSAAEAASTLAVANEADAKKQEALANAASTQAIIERDNAEDARALAKTEEAQALAAEQTAIFNAELARKNEAEAIAQARLARSRELASLALTFLRQDSTLTMLLGKEAVETAETGQALDALLKGLQRNLSRQAEKFGQFIPPQETEIYTVAASPDGRLIAWAGSDGFFSVWDLVEEDYVWRNFMDTGVTINAIDFSPDGKTLVVGDADGSIALWDISSGKRFRNLPTNILAINDLAFSPDGATLAFAGLAENSNPNVLTFQLENGTLQGFRIRSGEIAEALAVAWSPDGKQLASGGRDAIVHIWDAETGTESAILKDIFVENEIQRIFEGPIRSLAFSPNGKWLVVAADDNQGVKNRTLRAWDTTAWTKQEPLIFLHPEDFGNPETITFSPDGQTLVSGHKDGTTAIWNFNSQQMTEALKDHARLVQDLDFSQFEKSLLLVSGGLDRQINLNNLIALQSLSSPLSEDRGNIPRIVFTGDKTLKVAGNSEAGLTLWDLDLTNGEGNSSEAGIKVADGNYYLSIDGAYLAYLGDGDQITIQNLNSGETSTIEIPSMTVTRIDAEGSSSSSQEAGRIDSLAFSPNGERLVGGMCSERRTSIDPETQQESDNCVQNDILLWEVNSGALQKRLPTDQPSAILSLAFNPQNADFIAAGYHNATIQFWDLAQDQAVGIPLVGMGGPVSSLAFNLVGDILTSGSENNLIALWNVDPPQLIGDPLVGSEGSVTGLTIGPEQSTFYSVSDQGAILTWDIKKWLELACELAERNLSELEWDQFFPPDELYRATCLQYALGVTTASESPTPTATPSPTPTP